MELTINFQIKPKPTSSHDLSHLTQRFVSIITWGIKPFSCRKPETQTIFISTRIIRFSSIPICIIERHITILPNPLSFLKNRFFIWNIIQQITWKKYQTFKRSLPPSHHSSYDFTSSKSSTNFLISSVLTSPKSALLSKDLQKKLLLLYAFWL